MILYALDASVRVLHSTASVWSFVGATAVGAIKMKPTACLFRRISLQQLAVSMLVTGSLSFAAPGPGLLWTGVSFSGEFQDRTKLYPYTAQLIAGAQDGQPQLNVDEILRNKVKRAGALAQRISLEKSDGKVDSNSIAFALVQENVETQEISGKYWVIGTIQSNILVFNKESKSLVASYPFRVKHSDVFDASPTEQDKRSLIRTLYESTDTAVNVFDQWVTRAASVNLRPGARKYLRVGDVTFRPEAEAVMQQAGKDRHSIAIQVANMFETLVAEKTGISVVPHAAGEVIGGKMSLNFTDGSFYQLNLPPADFALEFGVRGFTSKTGETPTEYQEVYRVTATVALKEPTAGHFYLNEEIYNTQIQTRPKSMGLKVDPWEQFYKTLQELLAVTAEALVSPSKEFLKNNATQESKAKAGFVQAAQVVEGLKK